MKSFTLYITGKKQCRFILILRIYELKENYKNEWCIYEFLNWNISNKIAERLNLLGVTKNTRVIIKSEALSSVFINISQLLNQYVASFTNFINSNEERRKVTLIYL